MLNLNELFARSYGHTSLCWGRIAMAHTVVFSNALLLSVPVLVKFKICMKSRPRLEFFFF